jgi:hypothetical protein
MAPVSAIAAAIESKEHLFMIFNSCGAPPVDRHCATVTIILPETP